MVEEWLGLFSSLRLRFKTTHHRQARRNEERDQARRRAAEARESFTLMLEECNSLRPGDSFRMVRAMLHEDPRWTVRRLTRLVKSGATVPRRTHQPAASAGTTPPFSPPPPPISTP